MFDWLTGVIADGGYLGIVLLMVAENIFPADPLGTDRLLAGFVAAKGELNFGLVVLAGVLGSILGALPWYYAGRWVGEARMRAFAARRGRWLTLDEKGIGKAIDWFEKHGRIAVLLARLVPTVRTLISLPAGMARMPLRAFSDLLGDRHHAVRPGCSRRRASGSRRTTPWWPTRSTASPRSSSA